MYEVGLRFDIHPIPPIAANTKIVPAGALSFGVEYRVLNEQIANAEYASDPAMQALRLTKEFAGEIDDSGVSIHVFGADGREYLRFDCFREDPHYHYILPDETYQRIVPFDTIAHGDLLTWALSTLRNRLDPMLRAAGGAKSADCIDQAAVSAALDEVEHIAVGIDD